MRGRIKLALTSVTVLAGSAVAYHFMDHRTATPQPKAGPVIALSGPKPAVASTTSAAPKGVAVKPMKRSMSAVMSTLGMASFYSDSFDGKRTANGETFNQKLMTACHRSLPFGTLVRVVNIATGRSVVVRINDRGVLAPSRVIDLSHAAANEIGMLEAGVAKVRLEILGKTKATEFPPL